MILVIGGFAQGKHDFVRSEFEGRKVWDEFHVFVREGLAAGKDREGLLQEAEERLAADPETVVICDELGCGIVPMEKADRQWREVTGRLLCRLAQSAEKVYRVSLGIGVRIK